MQLQKTVMVVTLASLLAACNPSQPPAPQMTQMCGYNPQTAQQSCVMVPANQTSQYYNNGYYSNNNGVYRDSGGHEVAAGLVGAAAGVAAGYALSQHLNNRQAAPAAVPQGYYQTANGRWKGPDGKFAADPTKGQFVPQAAANTPTSKAPTGGMMAGQREIQLTPATNNIAQQPSPTFVPKAQVVPQPAANPFQPQAANKTATPLNTFTPKAAMQPTTPPAAATFKPKAVSLSKPSAPAKATFKPKASK